MAGGWGGHLVSSWAPGQPSGWWEKGKEPRGRAACWGGCGSPGQISYQPDSSPWVPAWVALWGYISHPLGAGGVAKEGQSGGCHLTRAQARPAPRRPCCSEEPVGALVPREPHRLLAAASLQARTGAPVAREQTSLSWGRGDTACPPVPPGWLLAPVGTRALPLEALSSGRPHPVAPTGIPPGPP